MANNGLEVLYEGRDTPAVDIVFVHGLRGNRINTWKEGDVLWPKDFLSEDLKDARVMTWGYDSDVARVKNLSSQNNIFGHSENFLRDLARARRDITNPKRPLVLVGYSLGGLLIKAALNRAHEYSKAGNGPGDARKGSVFDSTQGVVFLGVPHRGSSKANLGLMVASMFELAFYQPNRSLLNTLSDRSDILDQQRDSFSKISSKMQLACVWEEIPMSGLTVTGDGLVVPKESAKIDGANVMNDSIPKDHRGMCKFSSRDEVGYQRVLDIIRDMLEVINERETVRNKMLENELLACLEFEGMEWRFEDIAEAHRNTFEWIFQDKDIGFADWASGEDGIFWITGKPGSGKSTLMKLLRGDRRTDDLLRSWETSPVLAGFFFHDVVGSPLLKTHEGLLRAILFQILDRYRELIPVVFPRRWSRLHANHSTAQNHLATASWSLQELKQAMTALGRQQKIIMQLCLLIDGLDEFQGDHEETLSLLTDFLDVAKTSHHVKICLASRPLAVFNLAFSGNRRLEVHMLTVDDIQRYVRSGLQELQPFFPQLCVTEEELEGLVEEVQRKSFGVFLWVKVVVRELRKGAQQHETYSELTQRLRTMPPDISGLFEHIVNNIDPLHRAQAANIFQLVCQSGFLSPHSVCLALEKDPPDMELPLESPNPDTLISKGNSVLDCINTRLGGLVEVASKAGGEQYLGFLHVSFREYLHSPGMQKWLRESINGTPFDPNLALLRACLFELRYLRFEEGDTYNFKSVPSIPGSSYSILLEKAMANAALSEENSGTSPMRYLDALDALCNQQYRNHRECGDRQCLRAAELQWERATGKRKSWVGYLMSSKRGFHGWYEEPTNWESDFESWAARLGMKDFIISRVRRGYRITSKPGRPLLNYAIDNGGREAVQPTMYPSNIGRNIPLINYLLENGCDPNAQHHVSLPGHMDEKLVNWPMVYNGWTPWQTCIVTCREDLELTLRREYPNFERRHQIRYWMNIFQACIAHGADLTALPRMAAPIPSMQKQGISEAIEQIFCACDSKDVRDIVDLARAHESITKHRRPGFAFIDRLGHSHRRGKTATDNVRTILKKSRKKSEN